MADEAQSLSHGGLRIHDPADQNQDYAALFRSLDEEFPDFDSLAKAEDQDVLKHWEGLGYYSRARNLHKLARAYVNLEIKPCREEWKQLRQIAIYLSSNKFDSSWTSQCSRRRERSPRPSSPKDDARKFKNNCAAVKAFRSTADNILTTNMGSTTKQ